jgi:sRNA-binding carbon storage regulator CsrA
MVRLGIDAPPDVSVVRQELVSSLSAEPAASEESNVSAGQ